MDKSIISIPFNKPYLTGNELKYIANTGQLNMLSGDGLYTKKCHNWLTSNLQVRKALLTHSCTAALEIAANLLNLKEGDEVIIPSFTFVSTANAFVLMGATPVFVDIRTDTFNIDESLIEAAITKKTKAIVPVHYAGISCEMDAILSVARKYNLYVVEDAAQGILACYKNIPLGSIGNMGTLSFHETKNIISGEGGAILINDENLIERAEIIREKGTDRSSFFRGEVDKYTWRDKGSSYLPGEIIGAFLFAQLEEARRITQRRLDAWNVYYELFSEIEEGGFLRRPIVPIDCQHNGHIFYIVLNEKINRNALLTHMKESGVHAVFHYVPLHSSPGGLKYGKVSGSMEITNNFSERIVRLPLWIGITPEEQIKVYKVIQKFIDINGFNHNKT